MLRSRRFLTIIVIAVAACGAWAAVATGGVGRHHRATSSARSATVRPADATMPTTVPADLSQAFPVFRHARVRSDAAPAMASASGNPELTRLALASPTARIWLAPGPASLCQEVQQPDGATVSACTPETLATSHGIVGGVVGTGPGDMWFGVLPTGTTNVKAVRPDGATTPITLNAAGAFAQPVDPDTSLSYVTPDGGQVSIAPPANATSTPPGLPCPPGTTTTWCR